MPIMDPGPIPAVLAHTRRLAAVPPTTVTCTCQAAGRIAAGQSVAGVVAPRVAALFEGMVRTMLMTRLKRALTGLLAVLLLAGGLGLWAARQIQADDSPAQANPTQAGDKAKGDAATQIKRGDYLANQVARCGDCHTPRNDKGELDTSRAMQGAPTWFVPKVKIKGVRWDEKAPDITMSGKAGKWTEDKLVKFLSTGEKANAPMPAYNLAVEDAQAVTAYMRSLPGSTKGGGDKKKD
jgi:mono/diheme cytochrome c family protein